jgi:hypothetical protein
LSDRKLKPLPPEPVRHQDSAIALTGIALESEFERSVSHHRFEPRKAQRKPIAIRTVLKTAWQVNGSAVNALTSFCPEQSVGHVQAVVWVDADQMRVEGGVMNLRKRYAIRNDRLTEPPTDFCRGWRLRPAPQYSRNFMLTIACPATKKNQEE